MRWKQIMMNNKAQNISNRLSLRKPQSESLEILQNMVDLLSLEKNPVLPSDLQKVSGLYPTCTDFERDFPSLCFSLATGVGKTRLMGAFIAYLYTQRGIKNFFVLAPNLTIYNKLIDDLSNPQSPKYVFRGLAEFAVFGPRIITGDTYDQHQEMLGETVRINIFNISKINSEMRGGKEPRIKRLSEYLGESYFNYLAELSDLVLLMDESHHYRADAGLKAINELKPILGLELTATPIDSKGTKFKNVVYDYPLAKALQDGFVKEPAVATRRNFDPSQYKNDPKQLDLIKLEDGIRIHEDTKVALEIYSRDTGSKLVRPFVLVIAKDTDHAKEIRSLIESDVFFGGRYKDKVIEIHSNQKGEEKEENIQKLLALEHTDNVEIVIHVNMLKEGWDVTNLYTIIPLRAANSQILTEQTIGRGLRLPYGVRTGVEKVDKLTIVAHDRFQSIVDAANDPNSIIRKENIIEIDPQELTHGQELVESVTILQKNLNDIKTEISNIHNSVERGNAEVSLQAKELIVDAVNSLGDQIKNIHDIQSADIQKVAVKEITKKIGNPILKDRIMAEISAVYKKTTDDLIATTIPIPQLILRQDNNIKSGFRDFDLDTSGLNYQPISEEIVRRTLRTNINEVLQNQSEIRGQEEPAHVIMNELLVYPEIDYDSQSSLIQKLTLQALAKLSNTRTNEEVKNIVLYHKSDIAKFIYAQLQQHFYVEETTSYSDPIMYPFVRIERHNYAKFEDDKIYNFTETITPTSAIPSKLFNGFKKACHTSYKFDSKAEKDFASILENDNQVVRWLRPASKQFTIYWQKNTKLYEPDFVVETAEIIYLVEIKSEKDLDSEEINEKAAAAKKYCEAVSKFNGKNGGKEWKYILISHLEIMPNMSLSKLMSL